MSNILVIAAHPDDEILGLGGTIKKNIKNGNTANCIILGEGMTSRTLKREEYELDELKTCTMKAAEIIGFGEVYFSDIPDNRFDTVSLLDIIKEIESYINKIKPDIIYTHHWGDLNIDHRRTFEAVMTACRPIGEDYAKEIYCFETPSSTEWNFNYEGNSFKPNVFIDIEETIEYKLKAMECYKSEIREFPHPRSLKALEIISARWGTVVGKKHVEAFELIRRVD